MKPLLYLVHRIPYPPNKGDKIRSYHLLKYLTGRYRIYLGAFVDNPEDWKYENDVNALCEDVFLRSLTPIMAKLKSLYGIVTGEALMLSYYRDDAMQVWVDQVLKTEGIEQVVVFSSSMAQYVSGQNYEQLNRLIDIVDVDSDKWLQYSNSKRWPMSWIYRREGRRLFDYECHITKEFDACFFVSSDEADHFRALLPSCADKIHYFNNGVNVEYFNPDNEYVNPYKSGEKVVVFTGSMDYWANVDAVTWFARHVFPVVRSKETAAQFYIVGANPDKSIIKLSREKGIKVTGKVVDVRPFLAHAALAVAPLRIARGVQNKVLEAMAMRCPVIMTTQASKGIMACTDEELLVIDDPSEMAEKILKLMNDDYEGSLGEAGRVCVLENYDWSKNIEVISDYFLTNAP